ncbi:MAG: hypothetical protein ACRDCB_13900, partial [Clostridium sp.]
MKHFKILLLITTSIISTSLFGILPVFAETTTLPNRIQYLNTKQQNQYLTIPDPVLKAVMNYTLNKPSDSDITESEAEKITWLYFYKDDNLQDLTGLKYCKNLSSLSISGNIKNW